MRTMKLAVLVVAIVAAAGCGGGGGGDDSGGGGGGVSGRVPYLVSKPLVTFATSSWDPTRYDVTVTVEADGPTGVAVADVFITDASGLNDTFIDLTKVTGTKRWRGTTNQFIPLPAGSYRVEDVLLHDGDPLTADPLRTGWYMYDYFFSTSVYFVDEREWSSANPFAFYNFGLSAIPISSFTLP